jgi:hypothetical protein
MCGEPAREDDRGMTTADCIERRASDLLEAARKFQAGAEQPGSYIAAPDALVALEQTLQVLGAAWYQLAADAVIDRRSAAGRADGRRRANEFPRFQRHERPGRRVA